MPQADSFVDFTNLSTRDLRRVYESRVSESNGGKKEKLYQICRGEEDGKDQKGQDYNGVYFRNTFKVIGGDIYLHKIGFFGPKKAETAVYSASVIVEPSLHLRPVPWWDVMLPCWGCLPITSFSPSYHAGATATRNGYMATKGDIWWVTFAQPCRVPENMWMDILFTIEGTEATACMQQGKQQISSTIQTDRGQRRFVFLTGSSQMPWIEFSVRGSDLNNVGYDVVEL